MSEDRLRRWVVAVSVFGALVVGGLIGWRRLRPAPPAAPARAAVGTNRPAAERGGFLTLYAGTGNPVRIAAGTPILLEVSVTAGRGNAPITLGRPGVPWSADLRIVEGPSRRPLAWAAPVLGSPRSTAFSKDVDGRLTVSEQSADVALLDRDHIARATLAVSPETTALVAPGAYQVRAIFAGGPWGGLESAPLTVLVQKAGEGSGSGRVAATAYFFLRAGRFEEARRQADELSSREPKSPVAWMLLGDALAGLGKTREALNVYRRALAVSPRTYEEPAQIYERMGAMWRKLAKP